MRRMKLTPHLAFPGGLIHGGSAAAASSVLFPDGNWWRSSELISVITEGDPARYGGVTGMRFAARLECALPRATPRAPSGGGGIPSSRAAAVAGCRSGRCPCPWFVTHRHYVPAGGFAVLLWAMGSVNFQFSGSRHQNRLAAMCLCSRRRGGTEVSAEAVACWSMCPGSACGFPHVGLLRLFGGHFYVGFWLPPLLRRCRQQPFLLQGHLLDSGAFS